MASDAAPRVRRDVQSLVDGGPADRAILDGYAEGIRLMQRLDEEDGDGPPTNPLSWRYQAALHGIRPFTGDPLWSTCRHNSWYFLPWHRMYLHRFEAIVQHHLQDPTWALPYWDYTKPAAASRTLPEPFRDDAGENPLFVAGRSFVAASGRPIHPTLADANDSLRLVDFALPVDNAAASFGGGIVADGSVDGEARGALETDPHADMHGAVGGLMGRFATAALDPIFWLHHCNIDRLWEVWRGLGNRNPDDPVWAATTFAFYDTSGQSTRQAIREVLDTVDLGYRYESTAPPGDFAPGVPEELAEARRPDVSRPSPELVGAATDVRFADPTTVTIALVAPERPHLEGFAGAERWFLRAEGVHGALPEAAAFAVHVQSASPGEEPILAGTIAAFGIEEASQVDETHDGTGVTDVFDISELVRTLQARGAWNENTAQVRITPIDAAGRPTSGGNVRARRISFYRG